MTPPSAAAVPLWTVLPFAGYLASLALVPLALPAFWRRNRNKLALAAAFGLPVAIALCWHGETPWLPTAPASTQPSSRCWPRSS